MEPTHDPKHPKRDANSLAAKGTTDAQSADLDNATNLPRPDSTPSAKPPAAAEATADEPTPESQPTTDASADPAAANTQPEPPGESDPGASNTSNDEPL